MTSFGIVYFTYSCVLTSAVRAVMDGDLPVEKVGTCVVITMNRGENRFNNRFISAMHRALDVAERY